PPDSPRNAGAKSITGMALVASSRSLTAMALKMFIVAPSVSTLLSPRLAALLACGSSATSQLELHSALASPRSSPAARRPRLSSNCTQPSPRRAPRLRLVGHVSARTALSPRLAALLACGSSATSQLELHSALASPRSSPAARRPRLSSNCTQLSNCILTQLAVGRLGLARLERDVAVHTLQVSVSRREDEGGTPGANEGLAVRARGLGGPGGRDPRRGAARADDRLGLEGEVADARPVIAP